MDNMEFFDRFTLALFERLYSSFPTPVEVDAVSIGASLLPEDVDQAVGFDLLQAAEHAVTFLAEEGFVTHQGRYLERAVFLEVRLTSKGLAVLGSTPGSLENREPLIARIRRALAGGVREAGTETVKLLAQQAFSAATALAPAVVAQLTR
ncbi:hypothetical protein [Lysobacter auxotrophicus]|uniref:DUF2513 domain-containing protein n=1 Tax=Lysobacter auxotrophicus TaxID=2992573 RepID=A0ABM8DHV0_9GAMM|nr:hypothetical protein [Lysobacter auxotrophicus]BDU18141.1 hypothetical protein LA521A_33420 [Lysobacter auxotrophicus]